MGGPSSHDHDHDQHQHQQQHQHQEHSHSHDHDHDNGHGHGHEHSHEHGDHYEDDDIHEETLHFHKIIKAFSQYKSSAMYANHRRRTDFYSLPERQQKLLPSYLERMEKVDEAIEANYEIIKIICEDQQIFLDMSDRAKNAAALRIRQQDMEKVQGTIKQFVRDWSTGGKPERDAIYAPMIQELKSRFASVPVDQRGQIHVLVPGSGLGRLAFDIAHEGFSAQGNEFSYYMLLASNFVLNKSSRVNQYKIYPYIHSFSNIVRPEDVLTEAWIPDVDPTEIPRGTDFSMVAGDFLEVYGQEEENFGKWDAVVTCFFIDTAKNIVNYLETIHKILKKGGIWINAGPLLWHFENTAHEISIELSLEEVIELAKTIGFKFEVQGTRKSTYMANPHGMLKYVYECATWTAVKI
ncbi:N2227-like protein-domain-containing protein [Gamsiella multidivaricata]|uniref:N2227-like protein-domain-containing protein n=1 Tax=Gamsiella multidivaricata TaxID=101098 RepID=UPI00221F2B53|nr:N2227-like protein-domain-containing protein [Gamsiella multidivaricata]KAI7819628.1 N2227-like protein-domain-containing protein [Gamsiella multidivaricata]